MATLVQLRRDLLAGIENPTAVDTMMVDVAILGYHNLTPAGTSGWAWSDPPTRQRVFTPYLTATELEALRRSAKETSKYLREAFVHLRPKQ